MRIIRNERRIRVSKAIGQYATLGGLLTLVAGLVISFAKPEWVTPMLISLPLGYVLAVIGGFLAERYVGPLAHHDALATALKGLDNSHALLQYALPVPHVLLEPGGCTVFVVKGHGGKITCQENGRWKHQQKGKFFRQFAGQEAVGAPDYEAKHEVRKLERWLSKRSSEVEVPIRGVIVFVNPDVALDTDNSPTPAMHSKKLKAWLRGPGKLQPMSDAMYSQLAEALGITAQRGED